MDDSNAGFVSRIGTLVRLGLLAALVWLIAVSGGAAPIPGRSEPPPSGEGVALAYDLGGAPELDALGPVWYFDYGFSKPTWPGHPRLYFAQISSTPEQVAAFASQVRGRWWTFGNEPNDPNQDNLTPEQYVRPYHDMVYALKRADPQARLVPAGIANADWRWLDAWREDYVRVYGRYPPVDGWNFHDYVLETCAGALDVNEFERRALAFRDWVDRIGDGARPVFLTEYGVLYGNGCCGCPPIPEHAVLSYLQATTRWLQTSKAVTGWAWFAADTGDRFNGDLFAGAQILPTGEAYRDLAFADRQPASK